MQENIPKEVIEIFENRVTFTINKNNVYVKGKLVENRFKFVETLSLVSKTDDLLNKVVEVFGGKIMKTSSGYKLAYSGSKAAAIIERIYPHLLKKRKHADLILELSSNKCISKSHAPESKMLARDVIRQKIISLNALKYDTDFMMSAE